MPQLVKSLKSFIWKRIQGNLPWNAKVCYSQFGEDAILQWLTRGQATGFYVDIGAFHPIALSNTYALYLRGWRGLNVEPRQEVLREFSAYRPNDLSLACCIAGEPGPPAELFVFEDAALTTLDATMASAAKERGHRVKEVRRVEVRTINDLLSSHLPQQTSIDFLNLDVEGLDETVLRSLDYSRFAPRIIAFECHGLSIYDAPQAGIVLFLKEHGYELVTLCGPTIIVKRAASLL